MKVFFYGATEEAAKKKCNTFIKQLMKLEPKDKNINITQICVPVFKAVDGFPIPNAYRIQMLCEYSLMQK